MIDEVALGVFTHRTTYLPGLLGSLRKIGDPACVVVCADGPINANMARLWEAFKRTRRGIGSSWMMTLSSWAATSWVIACGPWCATGGRGAASSPPSIRITKRRDYEPWRRELLEQGIIEERDAGWMTGYFMLVDRDQVGDIGPDMNLPDPCTAIDTSYSVAIRARGLAAGPGPPRLLPHEKRGLGAERDHPQGRAVSPGKMGDVLLGLRAVHGVRSPVAGRGQLAARATGVSSMSNKPER